MSARSSRLPLTFAAALLALSIAGRASAAAPKASWSDRLVLGTSPGEPPTPKVVVVGGLYTLSLASLVGGIVFTLESNSTAGEAGELRSRTPEDPCQDDASETCSEYLELRRDERRERLYGAGLLGGSALLLLSGALVAELWENDPALHVSGHAASGEAMIGLSGSF